MDTIDIRTGNLTDANIDKIAMLFPQVVTEKEGKNGETVRAIDFDLLRQELSTYIVDGGDERYRLDWPGKRRSLLKANTPITKTLRPLREESTNFDVTKNIFIEGDNFEALKIIQESYLGKVKMIYIDPPYNTGRDFVYSDKHMMRESEYEDLTEAVDEDGNKQFKENTKTNPRFHSDWLSMMYERLIIARDLMCDDGVIFLSIDDNEVHNLRKVCDEVFGESNFIGTFKWNKSAKAPSLSKSIRSKYEYIHAYGKREKRELFGKESYNTEAPLLNTSNRQTEIIFPPGSIEVPSDFSAGEYSEKFKVELLDPLSEKNSVNENSIRIKGCFVWGQKKIDEYVKSGKKFLVKTSLSTIYYRMDPGGSFIPPADVISPEECGVRRYADAKSELEAMGIPFDYSKPVSLLQYLIRAATHDDKNAIILDFFAGSGSTAHGVMQLNAVDGGSRRFIMVQIPEETPVESVARKEGYESVSQIAIERIRRAASKIQEESKDEISKRDSIFDVGFRKYRVDESCMKDVFLHPSELRQDSLFDFEHSIKDGCSAEDVLTQVLLSQGLALDLEIEEQKMAGNSVFLVGGNTLGACFDAKIDPAMIGVLAALQPLKVVVRGSAFRNDKDRINLETKFAQLSPDTVISVL